MAEITEGNVLLVGRSQEKARAALAAARAVGLETSVVRTTVDGYSVPEAVAQYIEGTWEADAEVPADAEGKAEGDAEVEAPEPTLEDLSKDELIDRAKALDVPTSGNKPDLIERIRTAEAEQAQKSEDAGSEGTSEDEKE